MERKELEGLSREELIGQAEQLGVVRPRTLTIPELVDEILVVSAAREARASRCTLSWMRPMPAQS